MPDVSVAIRDVLLADSAVTTQAGSRVFVEEVPTGQDANMPEKTVVVRSAGGPAGFATLEIDDSRLSILCYAESPHLARVLSFAVYEALKTLTPSVWSGTYIHWAKKSVGPISLRDVDTQWPYTSSSWLVRSSDLAA